MRIQGEDTAASQAGRVQQEPAPLTPDCDVCVRKWRLLKLRGHSPWGLALVARAEGTAGSVCPNLRDTEKAAGKP